MPDKESKLDTIYDQGTQQLVIDLEKAAKDCTRRRKSYREPWFRPKVAKDYIPKARQIRRIVKMALQGYFHDYDDRACDDPKRTLRKLCRELNLHEIANKVNAGAYNQDPGDAATAAWARILQGRT